MKTSLLVVVALTTMSSSANAAPRVDGSLLNREVSIHGDCAVVERQCPGPGCIADSQTPMTPILKGRRFVYLNFDGVDVKASDFDDDARTNTSAIINQTMSLPAFTTGALSNGSGLSRQDVIDATIQAMESTYRDFDVEFVTERPAEGTEYMMIVFVGEGATCGGVTPGGDSCVGIALRDCDDTLANNIVYVFSWGQSWQDVAEIASHEAGHAYGLDHINAEGFIMYPTTGFAPTEFGAGTVVSDNSCSGNFQDSGETLMATIGPKGQDVLPPRIDITSHSEGDTVTGGSVISMDVNDIDGTVDRVELQLGTELVATSSSAPYKLTIPVDIPEGPVGFRIRAYDTSGNQSFKNLNLIMEVNQPCQKVDDCPSGFTCSNEDLCVPVAPDSSLGATCSENSQCDSGSCGSNGEESRCTQTCDAATLCPDGFECIGEAACWPVADGGGGCRVSGGGGAGAYLTLLGLGLIGAFGRRRRQS